MFLLLFPLPPFLLLPLSTCSSFSSFFSFTFFSSSCIQLLDTERYCVLRGGGGVLLRHLPDESGDVRGGFGATAPD